MEENNAVLHLASAFSSHRTELPRAAISLTPRAPAFAIGTLAPASVARGTVPIPADAMAAANSDGGSPFGSSSSAARHGGMALELDGLDALLPVHDPVAIAAAGGKMTDHRVVPMPHKDAIGLELVVRASVGQTHLCGLQLRQPHCSIIMRPGGLALPGTEPGLPAGHAVVPLYEVYHPRMLAAAFRPADAAAVRMGAVPPADQYGYAPLSHPRGPKVGLLSRSLIAQRLAWRMHLAVVVHIVAESVREAPSLGQPLMWPAPNDFVLRAARDLSACVPDTPVLLLRRLYDVAGAENQRREAGTFGAKLRQVALELVDQKLLPRQSVQYNPAPEHRGTCRSASAPLDPQLVGLDAPRFRAKCRELALRPSAPVPEPFTAVLGILSHYKNRQMRDAMRTHLWRRAGPELRDVRPVFLLDHPPLHGEDAAAVLQEAEQERDVLFLPTLALGRAVGFGRKLVMWFSMAPILYPNAALIGKLDDDALPCLANFARVARQEKATPNLYWGWFHFDRTKFTPDYKPHISGYRDPEAAAKALVVEITPEMIGPNTLRSDEQFVVLSSSLARDIAKIGHPPPCFGMAEYGGTAIGHYLSVARDELHRQIHLRLGWNETCHQFQYAVNELHCDHVESYSNPLRVQPDFCRRHVSAHPCKDFRDVEPFYSHEAPLHLGDGEVFP